MKPLRFVLLLCVGLTGASARAAYDRAADPAASADARALLRYLGEVADSGQVLSGQFRYDEGDGGDCVSIHRVTGKWPALLEHYFFVASSSPPPGTDEKNDAENPVRRQKMLEYWQQGGLVSIWAKLLVRHSRTRHAPGDWSDVWQPGTPKNNALKEHFDRFYVPHMKWLQERGVVLIFRPYNEEAVYFRDIGDENMRKLWVWTFDYFTRTHGLHNLIWFFAGNREVTETFFQRYPGDTYVDMVGFSDYAPDKPNAAMVKSYALLRERLPNKIFALAEEGWDDKEKRIHVRDAREIVAMIREHMPRTAYWLSWSHYWSPAQQNHCAELYADPSVLDRSEVQRSRARP